MGEVVRWRTSGCSRVVVDAGRCSRSGGDEYPEFLGRQMARGWKDDAWKRPPPVSILLTRCRLDSARKRSARRENSPERKVSINQTDERREILVSFRRPTYCIGHLSMRFLITLVVYARLYKKCLYASRRITGQGHRASQLRN